MSDFDEIVENIDTLYQALAPKLYELATLIRHTDASLPAHAAELPFPIGNRQPTDSLRVVALHDDQAARNMAADVLPQLEYLEGQHPKATLRLPGLIGASPATLSLINEINDLKNDIETLFRSVDKGKRTLLAKEALPKGIVRLQLYRRIETVDAALTYCGFSWASNTTGGDKVAVSDLIAELGEEISRISATEDPYRQRLEQDKQFLEKELSPNEILLHRRRVAPHPIANLYTAEGKLCTVDANLPIFFPAGIEGVEHAPQIEPLTLAQTRYRRKFRSDSRLESDPVATTRDVYRYKAEYRTLSGFKVKKIGVESEIQAGKGCVLRWRDVENERTGEHAITDREALLDSYVNLAAAQSVDLPADDGWILTASKSKSPKSEITFEDPDNKTAVLQLSHKDWVALQRTVGEFFLNL